MNIGTVSKATLGKLEMGQSAYGLFQAHRFVLRQGVPEGHSSEGYVSFRERERERELA